MLQRIVRAYPDTGTHLGRQVLQRRGEAIDAVRQCAIAELDAARFHGGGIRMEPCGSVKPVDGLQGLDRSNRGADFIGNHAGASPAPEIGDENY
jgi:hypothetical protein